MIEVPSGHLYLGEQIDAKTRKRGGEAVLLDSTDLTTHGVIVGMTGSGKTGLAIALIEEALKQGVPVIAIDPKGDLGNLLLLFESLDAAALLRSGVADGQRVSVRALAYHIAGHELRHRNVIRERYLG